MTDQELCIAIAETLGESRREVRRHGFQPLVIDTIPESDDIPQAVDWDELDASRPRLFPE